VKKILITGANGLLGRMVCNKLIKKNYSVFGIVKNKIINPIEKVDYLVADLSKLNFIELLPKKVDYIFHFSQSNKFRDFPKSANDIFSVNVSSTALLLDYAKSAGVSRFLFASSGGLYGRGRDPFSENAPIIPPGKLGYYLGSKACGEILSQSYSNEFFITVIRPFFLYGKYQNKKMLIPRIMNSISQELPINLAKKNGIRINPIHVEDASIAAIKTLDDQGSAIYNFAGPDILSLREIAEKMGTYLGKKPNFIVSDEPAYDLVGNISLMSQKLHIPKIRLLESLEDVYLK
tara:strand:+ start:635 stop:1507 length:873 start_codon:yes stop_codon:yes gene_type:complete